MSAYDDLFRSQTSSSNPIGRKANPFFVLFFLLLSLIAFFIINNYNKTHRVTEKDISSAQKIKPRSKPLFSFKLPQPKHSVSREELLNRIKVELDQAVGNYSVYIYDFGAEEGYGINEHSIFDTASVMKVVIISSLYAQAQEGKVDLEKKITIQDSDIQDYGSGQLRYEGAGKTYTVKSLARLMMEKSDNTAAYILATQVIGYPTLNKYLREWNLEQTDIENNKSTNYDMAMLFRKLYGKEIIKDTLLKEIFDFMKDTDYEDRIPAELPKNTVVYHKTGDQVSVSHDVGIVDLGHSSYYIGILTSNMLIDEPHVKSTIAKVSRLIYDYQSEVKKEG